jgi:DNA-binding transcriptional MerR regulator
MNYSIGQVAKLAKVTVRTLCHYDQTDLLHPSGRSEAGYRSYSVDDIEHLQQSYSVHNKRYVYPIHHLHFCLCLY